MSAKKKPAKPPAGKPKAAKPRLSKLSKSGRVKKAPSAPRPTESRLAPIAREAVQAALEAHHGNMAAAALALKISRQAVRGHVERHKLEDVILEARAALVDHAESALLTAVEAGEAWAVTFALRTQGKGRGYGEKLEHTGDLGVKLNLERLSDEQLVALEGIVSANSGGSPGGESAPATAVSEPVRG